MILGLGIDLVEVARVESLVARYPARAAARLFTEGEWTYASTKARPALHLAARFAAKEAVSKCFGTGIGGELGWRSVSVYHGERHQPLVRLDEKGAELLRRAGATHVHVTLSHTETMALAVAVLVRAAG